MHPHTVSQPCPSTRHPRFVWLVFSHAGLAIVLLICMGRKEAHGHNWAPKRHDYTVRPGDTLSEITLMFTGSHDYRKTARDNNIPNPDRIYPGQRIALTPSRPIAALSDYLNAIYRSRPLQAYHLLASPTRKRFSSKEFIRAMDVITYYDLDSITICHEKWLGRQHILQLKLHLHEDVASWGFNLVREQYKWYVWLFDLAPTFPREDGPIQWDCH